MSPLTIWREGVPPLGGRRTAALSDIEVSEGEAPGLLRATCVALAGEGFGAVLGPMRGNTWAGYRVVTASPEVGGRVEPPFPMEPDAPAWQAAAFGAAGFASVERYVSASTTDLTTESPRIVRAEARLERAGVAFRPINLDRFKDDLRAMHALSLAAFVRNPLYVPIPEAAFLAAYLPMRERIDPRLVELAEAGGDLVGLSFTLADERVADRVVLKTLARRPGRACAGLGAVMVRRARRAAAEVGARTMIHALMHDSNASLSLACGPAGGHAEIFRRYALYGWTA